MGVNGRLVRDLADRRSLEPCCRSPEATGKGQADAIVLATRSGGLLAPAIVLALGSMSIESDEERSHGCRIEHVGSPFLNCPAIGPTFRRQRPGVQHLSISDYHQQCVNTIGGPIGNELEIRSLRYFVAAAEELNFTRAAARLYVAQQALSRDIQRLEARLGTKLFLRTTRRVSLTPDGERLLVRARDLVARHDAVWADVHGPVAQPIVVDLMSDGRLTGTRILESARIRAPTIEFRGRYAGGTGAALERLATGRLDVVLGRVGWLDARPIPTIDHVLVRLEPLALLLPVGHPLAQHKAIPVRSLQGLELDGLPPHSRTPEWTDLIVQFFALSGAHSTPPHLPAMGLEEQGYHLVRQGVPILASTDHVEVPGGVLRPLVDPTPFYAWSMAWRRDADNDGLTALRDAAAELATTEDWLRKVGDRDRDMWLPEPDASRLANGDFDLVTARAGDKTRSAGTTTRPPTPR
jgi:DNA-binding transcriptional LysR family regulator